MSAIDRNERNRRIIEEFRANAGVVGGPFQGVPLLLLHHIGAKSSVERVNPLAYQQLDGAVAVFASKGGAPGHPDWYFNLVAHPDVEVEIGVDSYAATARVAQGEERERIWEAQKVAQPSFAEYEVRAGDRVIPVVILEAA